MVLESVLTLSFRLDVDAMDVLQSSSVRELLGTGPCHWEGPGEEGATLGALCFSTISAFFSETLVHTQS